MKTYKTCKFIKEALYLAPNEIRACCQRFFYKGKMRGDAKLIKKDNFNNLNSETLVQSRQKMLDEIQIDKNKDCLGCRYLTETDERPKATNEIKLLSVEQHSFCNLRCTYCSEMFYGGKKPQYDVWGFASKLSQEGSFHNCRQVVWGGGEPTLDKSFENIFKTIQKNANPKIYHRVFTNSVRYSLPLEKFLREGKVKITTSMDAGTEETYKKVRGRGKMSNVLANLEKYSEIDSSKITIKYILTDENNHPDELHAFVNKMINHNLKECYFQISVDYKKEKMDLNFVKSIVFLMDEFNKNGVKRYFVDDHVLARILKLEEENKLNILEYANKNDLNSIIYPNKDNKINLYGAGQICKDLINNTNILKNFKSFNIFDSDPSKLGKKINGIKVISPEKLKNNTDKIFITSAHSYDEILKNIVRLQNSDTNVINGLFL